MKNILKGLLVLLILVLLGACSKENLNQDPETRISEQYIFDTKERVLGQVNGMYAFMKVGNYRGDAFLFIMMSELITSCRKVLTW